MRLSNIFEQDPATASGAAAMGRTLGSRASGAAVARALGKAERGEALNPTLLQAIAPYADALDKILSVPAFRNKFTQLVKQVQSLEKKNQEVAAQQQGVTEDRDSVDAVAGAVTRRIMSQHMDVLSKYGPVKVMAAIDDVAEFAGGDGLDEIGSSDVSIWTKQVIQDLESGHYDRVEEAPGDYTVKTISAADAWKKHTEPKKSKSKVPVDPKTGKTLYQKVTSEEEQLDEILPALGAAAGRAIVGSGASALTRGVAAATGRVAGTMAQDAINKKLGDNDEDPTDADSMGDAVDTVTMDIPLLLRMMEYAREDAQEDMDLHDVAERMIKLSKDGPLSMDDYDSIVGEVEALPAQEEEPVEEGYYAPGPETMPGAVGPQEDTNVSFNQTKRMGDASVTVSANAKDMEELPRVLKLAGIEVEKSEPSVADAAVALAPHMPAEPEEEPCGCDDVQEPVKPLDFKYSTDKTALVNVLRDKLKRL